MFRNSGLRKEVIIQITILMVASLLCTGLFLLRFTWQEILSQRVESSVSSVKMISDYLVSKDIIVYKKDILVRKVEELLRGISPVLPVEGWAIIDDKSVPLEIRSLEIDNSEIRKTRFEREILVKFADDDLNRFIMWPLADSFLVTAPLFNKDQFAGALQVRVSLVDIRSRLSIAQKWVFVFTAIFSLILGSFGIWLLNKKIVLPVRRLHEMSKNVAAGNLDSLLSVTGPWEIAEVTKSFNTMMTALKEKKKEMQTHIAVLCKTNEELSRTRDELIQSEKMVSVGHLAAGMAHEIGNPLGALVGYIGLLRSELLPGRHQELADLSLKEAERIERLVRDLLDYAAPRNKQAETFDPSATMMEAIQILEFQGAFGGIHVESSLPPVLPRINFTRHRLLQVFINLLLNARDASVSGQIIAVSGGSDGGEAWIAISDFGSGIDPRVLGNIFNPFFSTKPVGQGRGLGLSVCHRILTEEGGNIKVRSITGEGTTFTVFLPLEEAIDRGARV